MIYPFKSYANDTYSRSETVWYLSDDQKAMPKDVAEKFAQNHLPMYEVKGNFEYDADADTVKTISLELNGVTFVPEEGRHGE